MTNKSSRAKECVDVMNQKEKDDALRFCFSHMERLGFIEFKHQSITGNNRPFFVWKAVEYDV